MKLEQVCVFLGSNPGNSPEYAETVKALGRELAERNIGIVYGGSGTGLMGRLATAALEAGGNVIGVIPERLRKKEIAHTGLTKLHVVESMHERKALMAELSDAFITLPGGIGTLEEFFEVLTWSQLGYHKKPCGLLDVSGYFSKLAEFLDHVVEEGFLAPDHRRMVLTANNSADLLSRFESYTPPEVDKWIELKKSL